MSRTKTALSIACVMLACVSSTLISIHAEESICGRIQDGHDDKVHVCFDRGATLRIGENFDVIRHTVLTQPKTHTVLASRHVGVIRIAALGAGQCANAELISGSAQALDWVAVATN